MFLGDAPLARSMEQTQVGLCHYSLSTPGVLEA
jgi:hypothetical protein